MPLQALLGLLLAFLPKTEVARAPALMAPEEALMSPRSHDATPIEAAVVERARDEVDRGVVYDRSYRVGDVPEDRGACTDLVIRALRAVGVDLQKLVDEDMQTAPNAYRRPRDYHGDYRRVAVLSIYFARHASSIEGDVSKPELFRAGDILFTSPQKPCKPHRRCVATHVAIVSDRIGPRGLPLVIQNGGPAATESDALTEKTQLVAHYRWSFAAANDATK